MPTYFGDDLLLLERLAQGGMAEVYRAKQLGTAGFQKNVAVKLILPHYASRPEFKAMFMHEMNLCANLQHPNIVQVFRNGEQDGYLYLVMEFVDGKTVEHISNLTRKTKQRLPLEMSCFIAAETAKGLHYAHSLKDEASGKPLDLVHRDVSPQNIMVSFNGEVKIVDFGIAKAADQAQLTKTGELKGKIGYIAPERWEGKPPDKRADVFALGVVLYELLSGEHLFAGSDTFEIMHRIREAAVPSLRAKNPDVPEILENIVMHALKGDVKERYQDAEDLYRALMLFMNQNFPDFVSTDCAHCLQDLFHEDLERRAKNKVAQNDFESIAQLQEKRAADGETQVFTPRSGVVTKVLERTDAALGFWKRYWLMALLIGVNLGLGMYFSKSIWNQFVSKLTLYAVEQSSAPVVGGVIAWYRADELKLADGAKIKVWPDLSFTGNDAEQPDSQYQPTYKWNAIAGRPVIHFDGRGRYLAADSIVKVVHSLTTLSFSYVARSDKDGRQYVFSMHPADREGDIVRAGYGQGHSLALKAIRTIGQRDIEFSNQVETEKFAVYSVVIDRVQEVLGEKKTYKGYAAIYRNGKMIMEHKLPEAVKLADAAYFSIGQEWDGPLTSDFISGDIAELIVFGSTLDTKRRKLVEQYLSEKYGIELEKDQKAP